MPLRGTPWFSLAFRRPPPEKSGSASERHPYLGHDACGGRGGLFAVMLLAGMLMAQLAWGQDARKVPISFVPPPLENATYSLGVYDVKSGKLARRLQEIAPESAFTVGLNGLMTSWDAKDDAGRAVPPGRYAARGYAVSALKVEGVDILGNDWSKDDEALRPKGIDAVIMVPDDEGLAVLAYEGSDRWKILRYAGADGHLLWQATPGPLAWTAKPAENGYPHGGLAIAGENLVVSIGGNTLEYRLKDGAAVPRGPGKGDPAGPESSAGKDGSTWKIEDGVLSQYAAGGGKVRSLLPATGEPTPQAVSASTRSDRLYLVERATGWQRVRGLSWVETKEENGKPVSTWQTFFERNIRALEMPNLGRATEIALVENPLLPGKPQKVVIEAVVDPKGSYLVADGLRLRQISKRDLLKAAKVERTKVTECLNFFQTDGAAWDEFSIEGTKNIMAFDAGEFDLTPEGEKTHVDKPAEPPDL